MNPLRYLKHKVVRDTATLQAGTLFVAAGNLVSAVLLAHVLGAREQGQYYVAVLLYSLLWFLLGQGVVGATVSQVAAANARGARDKAAAWLAFLGKAYLAIGAVLMVLGLIILPLMGRLVAPDELDTARDTARWALWLTATPLLELPRVVLCAALQGTRTMLPFARAESGQELVRVFLVILLAAATGSPAGPIVGMLVASAIGSWLALDQYAQAREASLAARDADGAAIPSPLPSLSEIRAQWRGIPLRMGLPVGLKLGLCRSIDAVAVQVLPGLLLQRFASSEWVAYVRLAQRLMNVPLMLMQGISRTMLPRLSELAGAQNYARFRATFVRASLVSGATISAGILIALAAMPLTLQLAFPPDYREPIWTVSLILTPGLLLLSFSIANDTFYLVTNQLRVAILLSIAGLAFNSVLMWVLAKNVADTGVAWGLSITMMWCVTHYLYAAWYFRGHRGAPSSKTPGAGDAAAGELTAREVPGSP